MLAGKEAVLVWFDAQRRPFWRIVAGKDTIWDYWQDDTSRADLPTQGAREALVHALDYIEAGKYILTASYTTGSDSAKTRCNVMFQLDKAAIPGAAGYQVSGVAPDEVDRRIAAALESYKTTQEIERLTRENAELKKQVATPTELQNAWAQTLLLAKPFIQPGLAKFTGQPIPLTPAPPTPNVGGHPSDETDHEGTERVGRALEDLHAKVDDLPLRLEQLAAMDKDTLDQLLGYLT